jgi:outer membrane lipoprotein-sorting protein
MRWDYSAPGKKLFLSDGKQLLLYIPDEHQLTRSAVKSSDDVRVPFRLLLSRLSLRKLFSAIEFADAATPHAPGNRVLRALPKRGYEEDYREVLIELTPALEVSRLLISCPDHSRMEFKFDRIERDVRLSPGLFRFEPPAGTEIIDQ